MRTVRFEVEGVDENLSALQVDKFAAHGQHQRLGCDRLVPAEVLKLAGGDARVGR